MPGCSASASRSARAVLDIQTGGGEVLAEAVRCARTAAERPRRPWLKPVAEATVLAATESWPPNLALARSALAPFGGIVIGARPTRRICRSATGALTW